MLGAVGYDVDGRLVDVLCVPAAWRTKVAAEVSSKNGDSYVTCGNVPVGVGVIETGLLFSLLGVGVW